MKSLRDLVLYEYNSYGPEETTAFTVEDDLGCSWLGNPPSKPCFKVLLTKWENQEDMEDKCENFIFLNFSLQEQEILNSDFCGGGGWGEYSKGQWSILGEQLHKDGSKLVLVYSWYLPLKNRHIPNVPLKLS